ncbi:MAG: guanylate kinase [Alphaproteobacteria bacterium]|nr:guanylate kinase [Alphaproteobacteria bacterium]MDX5368402.1 guanylate kinase [Alphaproteobacteria bacterium]MDX5463197.1 guanylate kinase [Alphaproteobacteria bacterium]
MSFTTIPRRGLMLVLSSPSGAGKTTLSRRLLAEDEGLVMSVSATTRKPRPGEIDGRDYLFVDEPRFVEMIGEGAFLEHAKVFGNYYGTPRSFVESELSIGRDVLFDIDWQGTQQLAQAMGEDLVRVFILPPSMQELAERLRKRAQDSAAVVQMRMSKAADELSHWAEYDYVFVNDDVEVSLARLKAILLAERLKRFRQHGLTQFVRHLLEGH